MRKRSLVFAPPRISFMGLASSEVQSLLSFMSTLKSVNNCLKILTMIRDTNMDELIYLIYVQWNQGHLRAILAKSRNFPASVEPFGSLMTYHPRES